MHEDENATPKYVSMQDAVNAYRKNLQQLRVNVTSDIKHMGYRPNTPCFCGSGVKFKKCCSRKITTLENVVKVTDHLGIKIDPDFMLRMQDISSYVAGQFKVSAQLAKAIVEAPVSDTESADDKTDTTTSETSPIQETAVKETI